MYDVRNTGFSHEVGTHVGAKVSAPLRVAATLVKVWTSTRSNIANSGEYACLKA